jgi:hypothetical protein
VVVGVDGGAVRGGAVSGDDVKYSGCVDPGVGGGACVADGGDEKYRGERCDGVGAAEPVAFGWVRGRVKYRGVARGCVKYRGVARGCVSNRGGGSLQRPGRQQGAGSV